MAHPWFTKLLLTVALLSLAPLASALESDREQPIKIQADSALVRETEGITVYTGNVSIEQGTLKVSADEVEIHTAEDAVVQIIASEAGNNLVQYEQQKNAAGDKVIARARSITYWVQDNRLELAGNASLQDAQDLFSGELLRYEPGNSVILESGEEERVHITIMPKEQ